MTPEIKNFLTYVGKNVPEGDFTKRLERAVDIVRMNPRWRKEYMNLEEIIEERSRLLQEQIDIISQEKDALAQENDTLLQNNDTLTQKNDTLTQKNDTLTQENDALLKKNDKLIQEKEAADARIKELEKMLAVYSS